jgi:hypothetical protein
VLKENLTLDAKTMVLIFVFHEGRKEVQKAEYCSQILMLILFINSINIIT